MPDNITIHSVRATLEPHALHLVISRPSLNDGQPLDYNLHAADPHGIAPQLRKMLLDASQAGEPYTVLPYEPPVEEMQEELP